MPRSNQQSTSLATGFTLAEPIVVVLLAAVLLGLGSAVEQARLAALRSQCAPALSFRETNQRFLASRLARLNAEDVEPTIAPENRTEWLRLQSAMQPGDELWSYENPAGYPARQGVLLVRDGVMIGEMGVREYSW